MKPILHMALLALTLTLALTGCSSTHYYVVRHAEKVDNTPDSPLTPAGLQRAQALSATLADKNIQVIFVSNRQRTRQTATNTATRFGLTPIIRDEGATDALITELQQLAGKNILVVRHSPEIHRIVNALSPADTIAPIGEDEFDNLFVIYRRIYFGQRTIRLERLKYGNP